MNYFIILTLLIIINTTHAACIKADFNIAIDIGHTKKQYGALSARGIGEFYFNQNIANQLETALKKIGYINTFIINPEGESIKLRQRTKIAKDNKADIFISIHHDSVQPHYLSYWEYKGQMHHYSDIFKGYSIFYSEENIMANQSLLLAQSIGKGFQDNKFSPTLHHAEKIKGENRLLIDKEKGIYKFDELIVLKTATMPAILVECGIIVNREEEVMLSDIDYQKTIVNALVEGINHFCQLSQ